MVGTRLQETAHSGHPHEPTGRIAPVDRDRPGSPAGDPSGKPARFGDRTRRAVACTTFRAGTRGPETLGGILPPRRTAAVENLGRGLCGIRSHHVDLRRRHRAAEQLPPSGRSAGSHFCRRRALAGTRHAADRDGYRSRRQAGAGSAVLRLVRCGAETHRVPYGRLRPLRSDRAKRRLRTARAPLAARAVAIGRRQVARSERAMVHWHGSQHRGRC
jgi:hypothetical protein